MTTFLVVSFLAYSAFCGWIIFRDGVEVLEGWKATVLFDWVAITLTASELRFGVGISWVLTVVLGLCSYYS